VRYSRLVDEGVLRRERCGWYFTMPVDAEAVGQKSGAPHEGSAAQCLRRTVSNKTGQFSRHSSVAAVTGSADGTGRRSLSPLSEFLNPSLPDSGSPDPLEFFDPEISIQENCWHGEDVPSKSPDAGFYLDGYYHGMLVLKSLPKRTRSEYRVYSDQARVSRVCDHGQRRGAGRGRN